jgi:ketosteroid isomerase-like protein
MKKRCAVLVLLALCASIAWAMTLKDDAKAEQVLKQLVRDWDAALVKGDTATLERLLADEFAFVGGMKKSDYLASFKTRSDDSVKSAESTDIQAQIYGDAAVLTGLDTISGQNKDGPYTSKWLYMDVWIKRDGRWQCVKTYASQAK